MGFNSHKRNKKNFWEHFHVPEHSINQNFPVTERSGEDRMYCVSRIINDTAEWGEDCSSLFTSDLRKVMGQGAGGEQGGREGNSGHGPERLSDLFKVEEQAGDKTRWEHRTPASASQPSPPPTTQAHSRSKRK